MAEAARGSFRFVDDVTSDASFVADGPTLPALFAAAADALLAATVERPDQVRALVRRELELDDERLDWLLLRFLNELIYLRDAAKEGAFTSVTDTLNAKVEVHFAGDRLLLETNWNAPNGRVMAVSAREPGLKNWKELVPERKDAAIDGVAAVAGHVIVAYLRNASSELVDHFLKVTSREE